MRCRITRPATESMCDPSGSFTANAQFHKVAAATRKPRIADLNSEL